MSHLERYKDKDGFEKLVRIIESSLPEKQDELMTIVRTEDSDVFIQLEKKMLTFERISRWEPKVLNKMLTTIPDNVLAFALRSQKTAIQKAFFSEIPESRMQLLGDLMTGSIAKGEESRARSLLIKAVRAKLDSEKKGKPIEAALDEDPKAA